MSKPIKQSDEVEPATETDHAAESARRVARSAVMLLISLSIVAMALYFAYRRSNNLAKTAFRQVNLSQLTTSGNLQQAALSHDGKFVAYVTREGDRQSLLVRRVAAAGDAVVVAPAEMIYQGLTFGPDDKLIYYTSRRMDESTGELYQVPASGGEPKRVFYGVDSPVAFSPNNQYLTFVRNDSARQESSLIVVKLDGSDEHKLVTRKRPETLSLQGPAWSPDGRVIVCAGGLVAGAESSAQALAVSTTDGSVRPIGDETWASIGQPAWLNDASGIVFNGRRRTAAAHGDALWLLTFPSGEARQIGDDSTNYAGVSVAADAGSLISLKIERGQVTGDAVLIKNVKAD